MSGTLGTTIGVALLSLVIGWVLGRRLKSRPQRPISSPEKRSAPSRADEILERMTEGVVVLDGAMRPVLANGAARKMLGLHAGNLPAKLPQDEILAATRRALITEGSTEEDVSVWYPDRLTLRVRSTPLDDGSGIIAVLQDATEELRVQQVRKEFVANASHELKSPVAGLRALAEAITEAIEDDPENATRFAHRLVEESERLSRLTVDLLDLSRLENPASSPRSQIDLAVLTEREVQELRGDAAEKVIRLRLELAAHVTVHGDEAQLGLIVRNLVENAIRYTPDGGQVEIRLGVTGPEAVLEIEDTGIGIPLEAQSRIFERFYRVDKARARDHGGTGLGLAIVKHAVDLHGGTVNVASEFGRGTTFSVRLPVTVTQPRTPETMEH
jgi:two-component system phosphate regulon sensor histidine kinase PhoR